MTANEWIKQHRAFVGKVMIKIDFKRMMYYYKITVEDLAKLCKYSLPGTISMLERGTIKPKIYALLKNQFPGIDSFIIDKKGVFNGTRKRTKIKLNN